MSKSNSIAKRSPEGAVARPGQWKTFADVEARARELLREHGYSEAEIDAELNRAKRQEPGD
jgi:hypothetical protein